jgi:hypothetical protein
MNKPRSTSLSAPCIRICSVVFTRCRMLFSRDPQAIVAAIVGGRTRLLDVGAIDFPQALAPTRRWFVNVAGAGYDAHVIARLPERIPSALAYFKGALSGLASYRSPLFHVAADGVTVDGRLLLALYRQSDAAALAQGDAICSALQLINFWQDVARDWQIGRVYIPRDALAAAGLTEQAIADGGVDPRWPGLMRDALARREAQNGH